MIHGADAVVLHELVQEVEYEKEMLLMILR